MKLKKHVPRSVGVTGSVADVLYDQGALRVTGFGRFFNYTETDWSFRPYKEPSDGEKDLPSSRNIPTLAAEMGIQEMNVPTPAFGTMSCNSSDLRTKIVLSHEGKKVTLKRGRDADACVLFPGQTYALSAAGCATLWLRNPHLSQPKAVAGHGGLRCLVDMEEILTGKKIRPTSSIIDKMWESVRGLPDHGKDIRAGCAFPISPEIYPHEWDRPNGEGEKNRLLCEYLVRVFGEGSILDYKNTAERKQGRVVLEHIICTQFAKLGIDPKNISVLAAHDRSTRVRHVEIKPLWHTTRGGYGKDVRNLILVTFYG